MSALSKPVPPPKIPGLYGLVFDLIGTLTDWHTPLVSALQSHASRYPSLAKYDKPFWDQLAVDAETAQGVIIKELARRYRLWSLLGV